MLFGTLALLIAVVGAGIYGVFGGFDKNTTTRISGGGTKVVRVALVDALVGFTPDTLVVDSGTRLVVDVVNEGKEAHDLAVEGGPRTRILGPGESQRLNLGEVVGELDAVCTLSGHKAAGMTLAIKDAGR